MRGTCALVRFSFRGYATHEMEDPSAMPPFLRVERGPLFSEGHGSRALPSGISSSKHGCGSEYGRGGCLSAAALLTGWRTTTTGTQSEQYSQAVLGSVERGIVGLQKRPQIPRGPNVQKNQSRSKFSISIETLNSGKKKEPKPKLFGPDISGWGGGLPRERAGAKKFDTSLETREIKLFGWDIPGFCRDIPEMPEKFEKKKFVFNFRSLLISLEIFNLDVSNSPQKIGPQWVGRSKISFSLEIFNLAQNLEMFWSLGPLGTVSESTVPNTDLSEFKFLALTELWGESSVSSSQPMICVPNSPSFPQSPPSLAQNSASSLFRDSNPHVSYQDLSPPKPHCSTNCWSAISAFTESLELRCLGARDSNQDPLANRIARLDSRDLKISGPQRGARSVMVGFGASGAPRFSAQRSPNTYF